MNKLEATRFILSVVAPHYTSNYQKDRREYLSEKEMSFVLRLATRNGLSYVFLKKLRESNRYKDIAEPFWIQMQDRLTKFKDTIDILNQVSKDHGLEYILIKMPTTLDHVPRDVDIFVHKSDREKAITAIGKYKMKVYMAVYEAALIEDYWPIDVYSEIKYYKRVGKEKPAMYGEP